jgi:hypothetical protein
MARRPQIAKRREAARRGRRNAFRCSLPKVEEPLLAPDIHPSRAALIRTNRTKWANGTVLHYYFFDKKTDGEHVYLENGKREWRGWRASKVQQDIVRQGFALWERVGIGLQFREVKARDDAEIRIGFQRDDGAWSYVGREVLKYGPDERTMNFDWDLRDDPDAAPHEIGHTLGFPHEHQNPNSGIVWNEDAVYKALAGDPNFWDRETTHYNIIRKISPDTVQGSTWDPNSIMHYPFEAGLIKEPKKYENGLVPKGGLSERDVSWAKAFYPPLAARHPVLEPFTLAALPLGPSEQQNFSIRPAATRKYQFQIFGIADAVMVLFEDDSGDLRYIAGDDDSGEDRNSHLEVKLFKGRNYVLRVRIYYSGASSNAAVMMW